MGSWSRGFPRDKNQLRVTEDVKSLSDRLYNLTLFGSNQASVRQADFKVWTVSAEYQ